MKKERYVRKLEEALTALQISGQAFDVGVTSEAIRLAATLRVLFHSNSATNNVSLVQHLKIDTWEMLSSDVQQGNPTGYVSIKLDLSAQKPVKAIPKLGTQFVPVTMTQWWDKQPIYKFEGREYFRSNLVRTAANQDGGSHVDSKLAAFYQDMEAGGQLLVLNGQDLKYAGKPPFDQTKPQHCDEVHLAMLRQFAHEVLSSAAHFQWLEKLRLR